MNKIFEYLIIFSFALVAFFVPMLVLCLNFPASFSFFDSGMMGIIFISLIIGVYIEVCYKQKESIFKTEGEKK